MSPKGIALRLFYTDHFELPLPETHRFPMEKYRLLRQRVTASEDHVDDVLLVPPAATDEQLLLCHTPRYLEAVKSGTLSEQEIRRIGFPWSPQMVERSRRSTGATIAASRAALIDGVAANLAGGTHHAFSDAGEGYCVFNDAAVAIRTLQKDGSIQRACVIDLDVHQGNGTASILAGDPSAFTLSLHGEKNFPLRKMPSDLDVSLPDGSGDAEYHSALLDALLNIDGVMQEHGHFVSGDLSCRSRSVRKRPAWATQNKQIGPCPPRPGRAGLDKKASHAVGDNHVRRLRTTTQRHCHDTRKHLEVGETRYPPQSR